MTTSCETPNLHRSGGMSYFLWSLCVALGMFGGSVYRLSHTILEGHRFAIERIAKGKRYIWFAAYSLISSLDSIKSEPIHTVCNPFILSVRDLHLCRVHLQVRTWWVGPCRLDVPCALYNRANTAAIRWCWRHPLRQFCQATVQSNVWSSNRKMQTSRLWKGGEMSISSCPKSQTSATRTPQHRVSALISLPQAAQAVASCKLKCFVPWRKRQSQSPFSQLFEALLSAEVPLSVRRKCICCRKAGWDCWKCNFQTLSGFVAASYAILRIYDTPSYSVWQRLHS